MTIHSTFPLIAIHLPVPILHPVPAPPLVPHVLSLQVPPLADTDHLAMFLETPSSGMNATFQLAEIKIIKQL